MFKKYLKNQKGFSLLELVVVIAVIAILAVAIVPNFLGQVDNARVSSAIADFGTIRSAAQVHYADTATWPAAEATENESSLLADSNNEVAGWNGPYVDRIPSENPFGGDFDYINDADGVRVELVIGDEDARNAVEDRFDEDMVEEENDTLRLLINGDFPE